MLNAFCLFFLRENLQSYQFYKSVHCEMDCLYCIGGSRRVTEGNRVNLGIKGTAWDIEIWNYGLKNSRGVKDGGERKMTSCGVGGRRISKKKDENDTPKNRISAINNFRTVQKPTAIASPYLRFECFSAHTNSSLVCGTNY